MKRFLMSLPAGPPPSPSGFSPFPRADQASVCSARVRDGATPEKCRVLVDSPPNNGASYIGDRPMRTVYPKFLRRITCKPRRKTPFQSTVAVGWQRERLLVRRSPSGWLVGKRTHFPVDSFSGLYAHPPHYRLAFAWQLKSGSWSLSLFTF